jgi:hypothetical protein
MAWQISPQKIDFINMKLVKIFLSVFALVTLFGAGLAKAQDATADAFINYTNPHDICDYYRTSAPDFSVVRESGTECLVSIGEGQFTTYTQYYYSGDQWCYKMTQRGQTIYSNCVAIPHSGASDAVSDFFGNFHIDSENSPYIIGGVVLIVLAIVMTAVSANSAKIKAKKAAKSVDSTEVDSSDEEKTFNPKAKRSGRGSYGWEEMETSTTEEINAKSPKCPDAGQSQGGIGLHQGEPITNSITHELERLSHLREKNVISQKEFELAKKKLLK